MRIERVTGTVSLRRTIESGTEEQRQAVKRVIEDVRNNGDAALKKYTEMFDGICLDTLAVTQEEIEEAYWLVDEHIVHIIREAAQNIREYHERQRATSWFMTREDGTILGQKVTPLDAVGLYVPGGTAAYPSSVLMNVIPAQVAGVKRIVIVSPPNERGTLPAAVLVAACELGVQEIYKVGGAQAIAALAYGTETIEPVDKIFGPGNIYVALAKREVFGQVDIDMIAGPSEIVVLADETAKPNEIAADLLSQAEHDERAVSIFVTPSLSLALKVEEEVEKQLATLPRKTIAQKAIDEYGVIYVTDTMKQAIDVVNELAPEHLEIMTAEPFEMLSAIRHAGAIFLGPYSSEPVGDYFAGTNHVLPTNGTARFSSGLTVEAFMKKSSVVFYSEQAWRQHAEKIATFARLEGLEAHARAVEERLKRGEK
ncbi:MULTISPECIES: histidinol dehydrogenase [Anoxybacillus]|uniref:Histidinol dehydrogenase n=1 Tax=Anoxybacillus flavithermus AK1 TaxID=1297581 RepID=M8CWE3_9BACL|nr:MULTISPECIES: histidinol dehydrogenase [Anoxybacillus]EMT45838.1 bifunctional histidinal dehydrogenase/ histidinol dehydrogenase [Anoxybacillus flavithermus AK1]MBW7651565.1 histidinol dehydrogenase [Anoxybacillus sp. ST4]